MTQKEVAARLGIQRPSVTNWELGRNGPNKRFLPRLAALYGCSVEDLLGGGTDEADASKETEGTPSSVAEA